MDPEEFLREIWELAGVTGLRPTKSAVVAGVFVIPCDFVIPGLVGFGSWGISGEIFGKRSDCRITPKTSAVSTGISEIPGDFVIPGLVGFGS